MKALKIALVVIAAIIVLFLIAAALAPKTFRVERKLVMKASPETVFEEVNSFKKWEAWSPWQAQDSTIHNTYSGPEAGVGSKTNWTSKKSGDGSMEIVESVPGKLVRTQVMINEFMPFQGWFTFNAVDGGTEVTWADSGSTKFPWNIFMIAADKMMGSDFERGLANLKKHVEEMPKWKLGEYKVEELPSFTILSVVDSCSAAEIGKKLGELYGEIGGVMQKNKLDFAGPVMAYYHSYSPEKVVLEAAVPVGKEVKGEGRVKGRKTPVTKVLAVSFYGDYMGLAEATPVVMQHMKDNQMEIVGPEVEMYVNDPGKVKSKIEIETRMNFPIK